MAVAKIFLLIVFQVIAIVQACNFTKEAKDEIELGYHKIHEYHYDFSTLNLTFTNIPKSFDCEMENGTEIKLALNYKVKEKPLSLEFTIDYKKGQKTHTESFFELNENELLENCQGMDFKLTNEFSDELQFGTLYFPGPGTVEDLEFDNKSAVGNVDGEVKWKVKSKREICTSKFIVQRVSRNTPKPENETVEGDAHQKTIRDLDYCQRNNFTVFPIMNSMDGEELSGIPESVL